MKKIEVLDEFKVDFELKIGSFYTNIVSKDGEVKEIFKLTKAKVKKGAILAYTKKIVRKGRDGWYMVMSGEVDASWAHFMRPSTKDEIDYYEKHIN